MKILEKLDVRWNKTGTWKSRWALFLCPYCNKKVERILADGLKNKSCGCTQYEISSKTHTTHGQTPKKLYGIWLRMRNRCYNKNVPGYKSNNSKGIRVCAEWRNDYMSFKKWALRNGYREGLALFRKNVKKNYTPENCFFTKKEHHILNRTTTKMNWGKVRKTRQLYKDGTMSQVQLSKKFNISQSSISGIVNNKLWIEEYKKSVGTMAQKLDDNELVSLKELLMANSIQVDATIQLLIEKGIFTQDEFFTK